MTVLEARYELGRRIGAGGWADVVEAYDRKLDRRVAVKLLRDGVADPRARERFLREAQTAAGFVHPNVVMLFDTGIHDEQPFLVMELVDGQTLREILDERGALPVAQAVGVADGMLAGLAAAHDRGLVHRDVKPGNVLVSREGRVKLADFGIAKAVHEAREALTATGQVLGTPAYLSPEQVAGSDATPASDVYATGILLYEMLAGAPPFTGEQPLAVALAHQQAVPDALTERRADVPAPIAAVVHRALEKDPARRFTSAREMRDALADAQAGRGRAAAASTIGMAAAPGATQTLPPAPTPPRTEPTGPRDPERRRRLALFLVALGLLALLIGGAVALSGGGRTEPAVGPVPSTEPSTTTTTLPPTTTTVLPQTLPDLLALVAADPARYGEKGPDLAAKLSEVLTKNDPKGEEGEKLIEEISGWVAEGQLDPTIGTLAQQLLAPYAVDTTGNGNGNGNGNGQGRGNGGDD
jgi:serine/threonine-protein kinase